MIVDYLTQNNLNPFMCIVKLKKTEKVFTLGYSKCGALIIA